MAKYVVTHDFTDLQDERHVYRVGDKFPRFGRAKKARLAELMSEKNKIGKPLIAEVEEEEVEEVAEDVTEEVDA